MDIPEAEKLFAENSHRAELAVHAYCSRFSFLAPIREDLISEARIGLWKACLKYTPSPKNTFWTFAYLKVRGAIIDFIRKEKIWVRERELKNGRKQPQMAQLVESRPNSSRPHGFGDGTFQAFGEQLSLADAKSKEDISRVELMVLFDRALSGMPKDRSDMVKDFYFNDVGFDEMILNGASSATYARNSIKFGTREIKKSWSIKGDIE